jgi:hypothetical protein
VEREGDAGGSPFEPKVTSEGELDAPGEFDAPHKKMERSSRSNIRRSK